MFSFGTFPRWIKALSIILCIQLVSFPILLQAAENNSIPPQEQSYEQICAIAEADARHDEGGAMGYAIGGFICGIFGWLFAIANEAKTPAGRLVGKDSNYVLAYSTCYEKRVKKIRTKAACTGWAVGTAVSLAYLAATGGFSTDEE